jgi:predicted nucleic acid-binding protein
MSERRLRVGLDANVLVAGILFPRWPYEVLQAAVSGAFAPALPEQVVAEARRRFRFAIQIRLLERFLSDSRCELLPMPSEELIERNLDLIRDATDVPIALSLLAGGVDILVTHDKDFTEDGATAPAFYRQVRAMLPAVFLRDIVGWDSVALESIRQRKWTDIEHEWGQRVPWPDMEI